LAPKSFHDVAALVALYRPGPMKMNVHFEYADRRNGRQPVTYEDPVLEEILGETAGLMIYQEDIMRVAQRVAGFTMAEADDLRKATAKKIRSILPAQREKFLSGCEAQGFTRELGEALFDKIEPFADYAFNKSHAYAYGYIAYQNAWLKANYPVEYMAALLTSFRDDKDKAALYLNEARQMGLRIGVPDVNQSFADYTPSLIEPDTIIFGMAGVRNVGESHVDKIVAEREANGPFTSVYDYARRVDPTVLNKRITESLVKAGAFDSLGVPRLGWLLKSEEIISATLDRRRDHSHGIATLFAALGDDPEATDWSGTDLPIPDVEFDRLVKLEFEREMLGTYVSDHPLSDMATTLMRTTEKTLVELRQLDPEELRSFTTTIGGIIADVQVRLTKADQRKYARIVIEDLTGSAEIMVSTRNFAEVQGSLVKDAIVKAGIRVDSREGALSFSLVSIERLRALGATGELRLQLSAEELTERFIKALKSVLTRHPGKSAVIIDTGHDGKSFKLAPEFNVDIDAVVPDLRTEFGTGIIAA
jgi:DNA polymerase III subunit alpha